MGKVKSVVLRKKVNMELYETPAEEKPVVEEKAGTAPLPAPGTDDQQPALGNRGGMADHLADVVSALPLLARCTG